jgi:uncharacterized membrane protein
MKLARENQLGQPPQLRNTARIIYLIGALAIVSALLLLPLLKVLTLRSSFFDLGVFDHLLYRINDEGVWALAFSAHAHWYSFIYAELINIFPSTFSPYLLVGIQSLLLTLPALPLYRRFGYFTTLTYLLSYPLWANVHVDFHFDHLAVPLLMGFYLALIDKKIIWCTLWATLLLFVKEPFALQSIACGLLLFWISLSPNSDFIDSIDRSLRIKLSLAALWLTGSGTAYFIFTMRYLLPYFAPEGWSGSLGGEAFGWLGTTLVDVITKLIGEPFIIISDIAFTPGKIFYLVVIFGGLAFLPLLQPSLLIPAIPLILISLLSREPSYYDLNNHYTAGLIVPLIFSFVYGLRRAEKILKRISFGCAYKTASYSEEGGGYEHNNNSSGIKKVRCVIKQHACPVEGSFNAWPIFCILFFLCILSVHVILSPSPISRLFWSDKVWSHSWQAYLPSTRDEMIGNTIKHFIPTDRGVTISTQNSLNHNQLAHRRVYMPFPMGIRDPYRVTDWSDHSWKGFWGYIRTGLKAPVKYIEEYADYVIVDVNRPLFLIDKGCEWIYGRCLNNLIERDFHDWIEVTNKYYYILYEEDGFMIFKRKEPAR